MDDGQSLIPVSLDGPASAVTSTAPTVTVAIPRAAAEHLVAWNEDQKTKAIHEAAHVAVATVLGIPVSSVTIKGHFSGRTETGLDEDNTPLFRSDSVLRASIVVSLAGLAAEQRILGEGTDGNAHDIDTASQLAIQRLRNGLDPEFPPIALDCFAYKMPPALLNLASRRVIAELTRARSEAERLVELHVEAILRLAAAIFSARRLDGAALDAAIREAGLEPPARGA